MNISQHTLVKQITAIENKTINGRPSLESVGSVTDITASIDLTYEIDGLTISTEANFARVADDIYNQIDILQKNIAQIERLHSEAIYATSPFKHTQVLRSREQYAADTDAITKKICTSLQVMGHAANDQSILKSDRAMRGNRYVALARKLLDQVDYYRKMEREQASRNRDRLVRLYKQACPDLPDNEIYAAIEDDEAREQMDRMVQRNCKPGEARKLLKDVNDRVGDIANIQHTIKELTKLHSDISGMINRQQAKLDTITVSVERVQTRSGTFTYTEKSYRISVAASSHRRRRWIIAIVLVLLIIGTTLGITFGVLKGHGKI
ncbi:hypothetical protein GGI07_000164 [Coemansia sp. Benny D115]|nr:hypothetical protein GGI07_000164 [Coemansia sp. Benny D115]